MTVETLNNGGVLTKESLFVQFPILQEKNNDQNKLMQVKSFVYSSASYFKKKAFHWVFYCCIVHSEYHSLLRFSTVLRMARDNSIQAQFTLNNVQRKLHPMIYSSIRQHLPQCAPVWNVSGSSFHTQNRHFFIFTTS